PEGQRPSLGRGEVWRRTPGLNRAFPAKQPPVCRSAGVRAIAQAAVARRSGAVNRFALAIGALPMLETARIGGDAGPYRSVAQLVEHRSPKPGVAGSSPATPAILSISY